MHPMAEKRRMTWRMEKSIRPKLLTQLEWTMEDGQPTTLVSETLKVVYFAGR